MVNVSVPPPDPPLAITMLKEPVARCPALSCTCAVKVAVPAAVGVPVMAPVPANVSPAGNAPPVTLNA